jgi:hypothetical protein
VGGIQDPGVALDGAVIVGLGTSAIGVIGALAGVVLGGYGAKRSQRELFALTRQFEDQNALMLACAAYLTSVRQFRLFITIEAPEVELLEGPEFSDGFFAMVKGGREYQDALQETGMHLVLLVGLESPQFDAVEKAHKALWRLAKARAKSAAGAIPEEVVSACRDAEVEVVRSVHASLHGVDRQR